jgi:type II secretory pathway predicted ATPase ExeA
MSSLASALKLENVVYDKKGPIAYVTLNRPKVMNALNKATINELREPSRTRVTIQPSVESSSRAPVKKHLPQAPTSRRSPTTRLWKQKRQLVGDRH